MALVFAFPGYEKFAHNLKFTTGDVKVRHFPDGESFVRLDSDVKGQDIIFICGLDNPDQKAMSLLFFTNVAKELGAKSIGLVTPYLGYMRQDKRFHEGEAITSKVFAKFISREFDWLITIDPHLHRYKSLGEIYDIPCTVLHTTDVIADWIKDNVANPILIGPDEESEPLIAGIAQKAVAPYTILTKIRHSDWEVEVSIPEIDKYKDHTPVLVDDIISTARTMISTVMHLQQAKMKPTVCIGVHAIFASDSYEKLLNSGVAKVITCNTIPHPSNGIDVWPMIEKAVGTSA